MYLTKEKIKELSESNVIGNYDASGLYSIGYDLRTECYVVNGRDTGNVQLKPLESVMVKSVETIQLPNNILAKVILRNSRIRLGLTLDAPVYQPGHYTHVFFRVTNLSDKVISLSKEDGIASIMFYKLDSDAEPYTGTFQDEDNYKGLASYDVPLSEELAEVKEASDSLKGIEKGIYSNVLQIMAIFVGIFSLLNVNLSSAMSHTDTKTILVLNLATIGSVGFLTSLIGKQKRTIGWITSAVAFAVAIVIQLAM